MEMWVEEDKRGAALHNTMLAETHSDIYNKRDGVCVFGGGGLGWKHLSPVTSTPELSTGLVIV